VIFPSRGFEAVQTFSTEVNGSYGIDDHKKRYGQSCVRGGDKKFDYYRILTISIIKDKTFTLRYPLRLLIFLFLSLFY